MSRRRLDHALLWRARMQSTWFPGVIAASLLGVVGGCIDGPSVNDEKQWTRIDVSIESLYDADKPATREGLQVELRAMATRDSTNYSDVIPATFTIAPVGAEPVAVPTSYWEPGAVLTGWESEYEIHVTVEEYGIDLVRRISTPSFYTVALDPIGVGQPATLTWSPNREPNVRTVALLQTPWQGSTETTHVLHYGENEDTGAADIPATGFPRAGTYYVQMDRVVSVDESHEDVSFGITARLETVSTRIAR
jgi:hypothetical protein